MNILFNHLTAIWGSRQLTMVLVLSTLVVGINQIAAIGQGLTATNNSTILLEQLEQWDLNENNVQDLLEFSYYWMAQATPTPTLTDNPITGTPAPTLTESPFTNTPTLTESPFTNTPTLTPSWMGKPTNTPTPTPTWTDTPINTPTPLPTALFFELPNATPGASPVVLTMKLIPAGSFAMGAAAEEEGSESDEQPQHPVQITKAFYISETEVTQAWWFALMGSWDQNLDWGTGPDYPMYYVSYRDLHSEGGFFDQAREKLGHPFRLPTEAEWEYACRGGQATRFFFGDAAGCDVTCATCPEAEPYLWWCGNNQPNRVKPVRQKQPNDFGLYDMAGGMWEWCQDTYSPTFYGTPAARQNDPVNQESGNLKVLRGGSWREYLGNARSANRYYMDSGARGFEVGFRVVLPTN